MKVMHNPNGWELDEIQRLASAPGWFYLGLSKVNAPETRTLVMLDYSNERRKGESPQDAARTVADKYSLKKQ